MLTNELANLLQVVTDENLYITYDVRTRYVCYHYTGTYSHYQFIVENILEHVENTFYASEVGTQSTILRKEVEVMILLELPLITDFG